MTTPCLGTIRHLLEAQATRTPQAAAILAAERSILSYSALVDQVEQTARALNGIGIGRKDPVAVVLPNGPEMALAFFSIVTAATCAPLNPAYQTDEFDFYLSDMDAKALSSSGNEFSSHCCRAKAFDSHRGAAARRATECGHVFTSRAKGFAGKR